LVTLKLLGGLALLGPDGSFTGQVSQRKRLALLALLAASPSQRASREKLVGYLWPESSGSSARHQLSSAVHVIKRALGKDVILAAGDDLQLNLQVIKVDLIDFEQALAQGEPVVAVGLYEGPFLDGFFLTEAPGFEHWADRERERLSRSYGAALERLAKEAEGAGELPRAVEWWKKKAAHEPYDSRVALALMRALNRAGNRAGALQHAEIHARLLEDGLQLEPDPDVMAMVEELRTGPAMEPAADPEEEREEARARPELETGPGGIELGGEESGIEGSRTVPTDPREPARGGCRSRRRWRRLAFWATIAAGAGTVAAIVVMERGLESGLPLDPLRIVVVPFEHRTDDGALSDLAALMADWTTKELGRNLGGQVQVFPASVARERMQAAPEDVEPSTWLAGSFGAGTLVTGVLRTLEDELRFEAEVVDARDGRLLQPVGPVTGMLEAPSALVQAVADRVVAAVAFEVDPRVRRWGASAHPPPSLSAFREVEAGMAEFRRERFDEALEHWHRAHEMDSSYLDPLRHSLAVHIGRGLQGDAHEMERAEAVIRHLRERRDRLSHLELADVEWKAAAVSGDLEADYRWAEAALRANPASGYHVGLSALLTNRPARAVEVMSKVDFGGSWLEGWPPFWRVYASGYHRIGRLDMALEVIERGRVQLPESLGLLGTEIEIRAALGQFREVGELLEHAFTLPPSLEVSAIELAGNVAMELRAHGHAEAADAPLRRAEEWIVSRPDSVSESSDPKWDLARVLYWGEQWERALPLLEELALRGPADPDRLGLLGVTLAHLGRSDEALKVSEALRTLDRPYLLGRNTAWRSRITAVLGDPEGTVLLLRQAYGEGQDFDDWLHRDPAFESVRDYPPFVELVQPRR
jgi:DNA-binding SARP family transcriptional activator/TolB-like protein